MVRSGRTIDYLSWPGKQTLAGLKISIPSFFVTGLGLNFDLGFYDILTFFIRKESDFIGLGIWFQITFDHVF